MKCWPSVSHGKGFFVIIFPYYLIRIFRSTSMPDVMFQQVVHLAESKRIVFPENRNSEERPDEHTQECQINSTRE